MATKYALVLCPDPSTEEELMAKQGPMHVIRHVDFGTDITRPSLGVVFELFPEDLRVFVEEVRDKGMKVGVYTDYQKALGFSNQAFGLSKDGTLEEVEFNFGGGET